MTGVGNPVPLRPGWRVAEDEKSERQSTLLASHGPPELVIHPNRSKPPPLTFYYHAGPRSGRVNPAFGAAPARGRSRPVLTMLAMLGRDERPPRDCAWLRSSRRGG
jgi:hypothetical protein